MSEHASRPEQSGRLYKGGEAWQVGATPLRNRDIGFTERVSAVRSSTDKTLSAIDEALGDTDPRKKAPAPSADPDRRPSGERVEQDEEPIGTKRKVGFLALTLLHRQDTDRPETAGAI